MSELKLPRLLAAAKEFNIGQDTLIEFLSSKGFPKDDLKPTAKLTESQYYALQAEFQSDKVAKNKADHVELPKNAIADKSKKVEEEIAPAKKVVVAETPAVETQKAAKVVDAAPAATAPVAKEAPKQPEQVKVEVPEVEAPKVINKIDLSLIDSSTRPKKSTKKTEEAAPKATAKTPEAPKAAPKKTTPAPAAEAPKAAPVDHSIAPENVHGEITNIQADKLTGPKILGKIELPINSDTRPKPLSQEEKRIRKRIPVPGRPNQSGQAGQSGQTQNTGGGYQGNRPQGGGYQGNRPQGGGYQGNRPNNRPGQAGGRGKNMPQTAEQKEIDQKAIQDKIKETQA